MKTVIVTRTKKGKLKSVAVVSPKGKVQLSATIVGRGIEVIRHPNLNGWIEAQDFRKWSSRARKLAVATSKHYASAEHQRETTNCCQWGLD